MFLKIETAEAPIANKAGPNRSSILNTGSFSRLRDLGYVAGRGCQWVVTYLTRPERHTEQAAQQIDHVNAQLGLGYIDRTKLEGTFNVGLPMSRVESGHGHETQHKHEPRVFAESESGTSRDRNEYLNSSPVYLEDLASEFVMRHTCANRVAAVVEKFT